MFGMEASKAQNAGRAMRNPGRRKHWRTGVVGRGAFAARLLGLAFCALVVFTLVAASASLADDGGGAGAFLKNGIGVRPISMGKAFVAVADDAHAGYWNPAGLAGLGNGQLSAMYSNPMNYALLGDTGLKDIGYHTMSLGYPLPFGTHPGAVGLNLAYLSAGDILVVKDDSGPTGDTFSDSDLAVILSYANAVLGNQLYLGANLTFIRQQVWENSGSGMGLDVGSIYRLSDNLKLALMFQNLIQPKIKLLDDGVTNSVPRTLKLGISYKLLDDMLLIATGMDKSGGRSAKFHLGVEAKPIDMLSLRGGYTTDTGEISVGLGVHFSAIQLDYGFGFLNLGSTHRIAITVDFSELANNNGSTAQDLTDQTQTLPADALPPRADHRIDSK